MEFRLLGPLEVQSTTGPVPLGGTRQRAALAYLLLHTNQVVPTRQLLSAVWAADREPGTARKILQNAIWRLRRTLAVPAGEPHAPQLLTRAPGYVVRVAPERVDLMRFQWLAAQGRAALSAGDPERACGALRKALSLWRGPALADLVEEGMAWPELAALEHKRLDIMEDCFEVELQCGEHQSILRDLDAFVRAEPLRERASQQLMLALYRCGRQADALGVYARIRAALVEGLGLEPGRETQRLQQSILAQDPGLDLSAGPRTTTALTLATSPAPDRAESGTGARADGRTEASVAGSPDGDGSGAGAADGTGTEPGGAGVLRVPGPRDGSTGLPEAESAAAAGAGAGAGETGAGAGAEADARPGTGTGRGTRASNGTGAGPENRTDGQAGGGAAPSPSGAGARAGNGTEPCGPPTSDSSSEAYRPGSVLMLRFGLGTEADGLPPGDIDRVLDTVCELAREEIAKAGGLVATSIGSVLLGLFEEERPARDGNDGAERAVRAGLAIRNRLSIPASPLAPSTPVIHGLSVHAAVVTGTAVVRQWPASASGAVQPWIGGDLVDRCEAMLSLAPPGEIRVCDETRRRTEHRVDYHRPPTSLGGWRVRTVHPVADGEHACCDGESELDLMTGFLDRARQRSTPHLITVLGHSDLGRTRLLTEFHRRVADAGPDAVRVLTGSVPASGDALSVPAEMLAAYCGIALQDGPGTARRKLATAFGDLARATTGTGAADAAAVLPLLERLVTGAPTGDDPRPVLDSWRRFMAMAARTRPLVMIWDSLHRADDVLLAAVEQLCADCPEAPLLMVAGARNGLSSRRPVWSTRLPHAMTLRLAPPAEDALDRLLRSLPDTHAA